MKAVVLCSVSVSVSTLKLNFAIDVTGSICFFWGGVCGTMEGLLQGCIDLMVLEVQGFRSEASVWAQSPSSQHARGWRAFHSNGDLSSFG